MAIHYSNVIVAKILSDISLNDANGKRPKKATGKPTKYEAEALQWKHVIWNEKWNGLLINQAIKANRKLGATKNERSRMVVLTDRMDDFIR